MPKRWTPAEEAALFKESAKHSVEELAVSYGVTAKSVSVKLQKLRQAMRKTGVADVLLIPRQRQSVGGEAKRWTPDEETELYSLHLKGWKTERLANHFSVSSKAISVKLLKVKKKFAAQGGFVESTSVISQPPIVSIVKPEPIVVRKETPVLPAAPKPKVVESRPQQQVTPTLKPVFDPRPRPPALSRKLWRLRTFRRVSYLERGGRAS